MPQGIAASYDPVTISGMQPQDDTARISVDDRKKVNRMHNLGWIKT